MPSFMAVPTAPMIVYAQNSDDIATESAINNKLQEYVGRNRVYQSSRYWRVELSQHQISELRRMPEVGSVHPPFLGDVPYDPTDSWVFDHIYCGTGYPNRAIGRRPPPTVWYKALSMIKKIKKKGWVFAKTAKKDDPHFSWTQPKTAERLNTCHGASHHIAKLLPAMQNGSTEVSRTTRRQSCRLLSLPTELRMLIFSFVIEVSNVVGPLNLLEENIATSVFRHNTWLAIHQGHVRISPNPSFENATGVEYKTMVAAMIGLMRSCRVVYHELLHFMFANYSLELEPHTEAVYKFLSHASVDRRLAIRRLTLRFVIPLGNSGSQTPDFVYQYFPLRRPQVMKMLTQALPNLQDVTCLVDTRNKDDSIVTAPIAYALAVVLLPIWSGTAFKFLCGSIEYEETAVAQRAIIEQARTLLETGPESLIGASTDMLTMEEVCKHQPIP